MNPTRRSLLASVAALPFIGAATQVFAQAQAAPPPLEIYGRLPGIDFVALSPSGARVAMVVRRGDDRMVIDYEVATQKTSGIPLGKITPQSVFWVDDTYMVVTTRKAINNGGEVYNFSQGVILDIPNGKSHLLSGQGDDFSETVFSSVKVVEVDGKKMLYMFRNNGLELVDPATGHGKLLYSDVPVDDFISDAQGHMIAGEEYKYDIKEWRLRFNVNGDWKIVVRESGRVDIPVLGGLGRDGKSVVVFENQGDRKGQYYEVTADGAYIGPLNPNHPLSSPIYHPKTGHLVGFANYGDTVEYAFFDSTMASLPAQAASAFEGYRVSLEDFAEDPRKTIVRVEGDDDAGTYFFVDFGTGKNFQIGSEYPDLPPEWIAAKTAFSFKAKDGLEIQAYLTLPPQREAKNLALVVIPHGGPESRDDMSFFYKAQALASRGYAVLQVNYRGSTGYGRSFVEAGYGEWGRKMQTDLSDGVRDLVARGIVDPKRVAIWGASYGGYAAMAGAAFDTSVYKCAVAVSGISDLREFVRWEAHESYSEESGTTLYWKRQLGDESRWDDFSPGRHAQNVTIPLLLIHGKDDSVVPMHQSELMRDAMSAAGKPAQFVQLNGEDHWMSVEATRQQMLSTVMDFLLKNNPPNQA